MNSKQIAIKYIGQKINNPKIIFEDLNIFKSILFFSRDAAREYFSTQLSKYFLVDYIDISKIKMNFCEDIDASELNIDNILELERVNKFSKKEKIKLLKEVWKQAYYDDFDEYDMQYLVEKLDLTTDEVFENKGDLIKINLKKEQAESGNSQLVLIF